MLIVSLPAFMVWLIVRAINRRERWAKWTAVIVVLVSPVLYLLAYGPWILIARAACGYTAEDASVSIFEGANSFARTAEPAWMVMLTDPYVEYLRLWIHESDEPFP